MTTIPAGLVVLEKKGFQTRIYTIVTKIDINPLSGAGYVRQFHEIATLVQFQPLYEISDGYKGRVRSTDLTDFIIRRPNDNELLQVLNIPQNGLPLGWLDYGETNQIFRYPLDPEDTLYQSLMIAGVQGKGKTNALHMLIRSLTSNANIATEERPAIINLDGEGQYKKFTKKS